MAVLVNSGRAAAAEAIKAMPIHMAWGSGDPAWDGLGAPPTVPLTDTGLTSEIGRRVVTQSLFCTPSSTGEIVVPQGRFTVSIEPTRHLYMRFAFGYEDAPASTIREIGIFVGTVTKNTLPPGQEYFIPSQLDDSGLLLVAERINKLERSASIRQQFEFVVTF